MSNQSHYNDRSARWVFVSDSVADIPKATTDEGNSSAEVIHTRNYVWNTSTLVWDRMTQSSGTSDTELENGIVLADGMSNPTVPRVGSALLLYNGSTWDRVRGDTTYGVDVDVTRISGTVAVTQSGSWGVTQSGSWGVNLTGETSNVGVGAIADAEAVGNGSVIAILKRIRTLLSGGLPAALVSGRLDVNIGGASATVTVQDGAGSITTDSTSSNPATSFGKTVNSYVLAQGAAGTTLIAAASATNKHKITGIVLTLSAAGTIKFTDGAGDLTGAMDVAANSGFVVSPSIMPIIETSIVNTTLSIVTTGGAAKGIIRYVTEA